MERRGEDGVETKLRSLRQSLPDIEGKIGRDPNLSRLWRWVRTIYATHGITLRGVAREVCLSPDHMNDLLKGACGLTLKQLLIRIRLLAAADILAREPNTRIEEVGLRVGFGSVSAFERRCKDNLGVAPRVLKKLEKFPISADSPLPICARLSRVENRKGRPGG
ncbi:MAG: helix-turn-helix transcriptional regulator [Blastocatellia bacterium]